jgi:hypothetical protein
MKGSSNIISAVHHLKMASEHLEDFNRQHPATKGAMLFNGYKKRIEWIVNDLITLPMLPQSVRDGIKSEWQSDAFAVDAIAEKSALLNPALREMLEALIDNLLKGEQIQIEQV